MIKSNFKAKIKNKGVTRFPCPSCGKGLLRVQDDTFRRVETNSSKGYRNDPDWGPDWIEYIYICLFECTNSNCQDIIASSGIGSVSFVDYDDRFIPQYFTPHLKFFSIPYGTPKEVSDEINISFSLFFSDSASSANHVRIALEYLLDYLKIKRFTRSKGKKNKHLSLHARIDLLPKKYEDVKDLFMAVKWLGNAGSHSNKDVRKGDVLDCYHLMNELLSEVIYYKSKTTKSLAKAIIEKKGPK